MSQVGDWVWVGVGLGLGLGIGIGDIPGQSLAILDISRNVGT